MKGYVRYFNLLKIRPSMKTHSPKFKHVGVYSIKSQVQIIVASLLVCRTGLVSIKESKIFFLDNVKLDICNIYTDENNVVTKHSRRYI